MSLKEEISDALGGFILLLICVVLSIIFVTSVFIIVLDSLRPEKPQPVVETQSDCICECPNP
jgi:hypothetical protein